MRMLKFSSVLLASSCLVLAGCQTTLVEKPKAQEFAAGINAERNFDYAQAFTSFSEAAKSSNASIRARALFKLSELYASGTGVAKDTSKAIALLQEAAQLNEPNATLSLADAYASGKNIPQDLPKAIALYTSLHKTNPAAALKLYKLQHAQQQDAATTTPEDAEMIQRALLTYDIQSGKNNSSAMLALAREYRDGTVVAQSDSEAERWYIMAVQSGNANAAQELAQFWLSKQPAYAARKYNALQLLEQAAESGNINAMLDVAEYLNDSTDEHANPLKAQEWLKRAADKGNAGAMTKLGKSMTDTFTNSATLKEGMNWLEKASELGYASASLELGRIYRDRTYAEPYYSRALEYFTKALHQGSDAALAEIANAYILGQGVATNTTYAKALLEEGVSKGQPNAMAAYAELLLSAPQSPESVQKALNYLQQAADAGTPSANSQLGTIYANGITGIPANPTKAFHYHLLAAKAHSKSSMEYVANAYAQGLGTPKDAAQAFAWNQEAAHAKMPRAMVALSIAYSEGSGTAKNPDAAKKWLDNAYKTQPEAILNVAKSYETGKNGIENKALAQSLYEKAVTLNIPTAQEHLDRLLGKHTAKKHGMGGYDIATLKTMAQQGNADAQYALAQAYRHGKGIAQDSEQALQWFTKAAAQNHSDAMVALAEASNVGYGIDQDASKAFSWYEKAAALGNSTAQFQAGMMLSRGIGTKADNKKAALWLKKAAAQGNSAAAAFVNALPTTPPTN